MKKIFCFSLALMFLINMNAIAQYPAYATYKDSVDGGVVYNGLITFDDLNKELSFTWLNEVNDYKPSENVIEFLQTYLKPYTMVLFMGTWCDDSHYLIPRLERVLNLINYPSSNLTMYGVDRAKTTKNGDEKKYNITLVPTIILFKDGKEIGRITESVKKTIEDDLAAMISYPPAH
jgi:thiol-disulfide isomerase/thioredoxin